MMFNSETEFEIHIRKVIEEKISTHNSEIVLLQNKDVADILVCKNSNPSRIFFIEAKFHKTSNGRIGFGNSQGGGFQPEILTKRPKYFDENMIWIFGKENDDKFYIGRNDEVSKYFCGGQIRIKFNNFQSKIYKHLTHYSEEELTEYLKKWFEQGNCV
ncbi:hypothetical protein GJU42_05940 [Flavobacterium resistens]|uniref:Restriction endonuclease n=2 Tax=Flavobacterium resistens TaxID=443612 RepID=A0ABW9Q388_9FLAO|nr:hypothetical protein [Flavobacterium resistens]MRX67503.1 hypothetical protein [Flavobacterium resistens]